MKTRIFCDDLDTSVSLRLTNVCTVFQGKLYENNEAAKGISQFFFRTTTIEICIESVAAFNAMNSNITTSK